MNAFLGIAAYEYRMAVRRWGVWLALALAAIPYLTGVWNLSERLAQGNATAWQLASVTLLQNLLMPVVGGIAIADRLPRDEQLRVHEMLASALPSQAVYVLGKYVGALLAVLTPVFLITILPVPVLLARGAPLGAAGTFPLAFLAINAPAYAFVGAFSLACPAILPVRVYQILFTGYWVWGNFLTPEFLPTLSGTLLNASGIYPANGFFGAGEIGMAMGRAGHTPLDATLNLLLLAACAGIALLTLERYLSWRELGSGISLSRLFLDNRAGRLALPSFPRLALAHRRDQFWLPAGLWGLFAIIGIVFRDEVKAVQAAAIFLGMVLPLLAGIMSASALVDDPAIELLLATPRRPWFTLLERLTTLLVVTAFAALTYQAFLHLLGADISDLGTVITRQLVWLVPTITCMGLATLIALASAQPMSATLGVGAVWIAQVLLRDFFMESEWASSVFLFLGAWRPESPHLATSQICLLGLTAAFLAVGARLLKTEERYL